MSVTKARGKPKLRAKF